MEGMDDRFYKRPCLLKKAWGSLCFGYENVRGGLTCHLDPQFVAHGKLALTMVFNIICIWYYSCRHHIDDYRMSHLRGLKLMFFWCYIVRALGSVAPKTRSPRPHAARLEVKFIVKILPEDSESRFGDWKQPSGCWYSGACQNLGN